MRSEEAGSLAQEEEMKSCHLGKTPPEGLFFGVLPLLEAVRQGLSPVWDFLRAEGSVADAVEPLHDLSLEELSVVSGADGARDDERPELTDLFVELRALDAALVQKESERPTHFEDGDAN
eukprot:CAMPEP_0170479596 /NCGR_PEP_ID=MMETSP0208-20121228/771_1 /TAXON_ID=197538 /ORGANISM="Strombidium inclinatum, Strain S3" /LENGTH=119 /DNA_ID=CAMNT_0010752017 /DNA_START=794 /DNA_END=1155 /DNA_ORIENTATION=-